MVVEPELSSLQNDLLDIIKSLGSSIFKKNVTYQVTHLKTFIQQPNVNIIYLINKKNNGM